MTEEDEEAYLAALRERQRPWRELEEAVAELRGQVEKKWLLPLADTLVRVDRKLRGVFSRGDTKGTGAPNGDEMGPPQTRNPTGGDA